MLSKNINKILMNDFFFLKSLFEENASQTIIKHLEMIPCFFFTHFFMTQKRKHIFAENHFRLIQKAPVCFGR